MVAWLAPAIGAAGSIISGMFGASAEREAANKNWQINLMNYYARERERADANWQASLASQEAKKDKYLAREDAIESRDYMRREAEEAKQLALQDKKDSRLGQTDAYGNRSYFKDGEGWVSELSPVMQALQDRYLKEEGQVLDNDLVKQRELFDRNVARQKTEGDMADSLLWRMKQIDRTNPADIEGELNHSAALAIQEGYGSALQQAMTSALRTGASNSGEVAAAIGRDRAKALVQAFADNKIRARGVAESEYDNEVGRVSNLYGAFASRASADPNVGYNPRNLGGNAAGAADASGGATSALLNAFANTANAGGRTLQFSDNTQNAFANQIRTAGMQGGTLNGVQPQYGTANAIGGAGNAISALLERFQAQNERDGAYKNASMYRGNAGMF